MSPRSPPYMYVCPLPEICQVHKRAYELGERITDRDRLLASEATDGCIISYFSSLLSGQQGGS